MERYINPYYPYNAMKQARISVKLTCQCGEVITGNSHNHALKNLEMHILTSNSHKEKMELIKRTREENNNDTNT